METQEYQTLVQTLMSNHLAASASEAQRMAKEMLGISEKVNNDSKKEQHYMIRGFKPSGEHVSQASGRPDVDMATGLPHSGVQSPIAVEPQMQQEPLQPVTNTSMPDPANMQGSAFIDKNPMQNKIDELRQRAINPEPTNVQVDFQTPNFDRIQAEQTPAFQPETSTYNTTSQSPQNSELTGRSDFASNQSQTISPEEYAANKFGNDSLNNLQSDFLSLKTPQETTNKPLSADWPAQQPQQNVVNNNQNVSNNFESGWNSQVQQPSMEETFQQEATENTTKEIKTEKKESSWTAEEERLKKEVDLTRVFNFSNK